MSYCDWAITSLGNKHEFGDVEVVSWDIEGRQYRTDDTDRPRRDDRYFGQDFVTPGDITIELIIRAKGLTRQDRFEEAMRLRSEFEDAWSGDSIRFTPGATSELLIAGRSVVDGRPRHVDWDDSKATFGIIRGTALFVRNTNEVYSKDDDGWLSTTVGLVPPQHGGLVAPLVAPLTTSRRSNRSSSFTVEGSSPVWPIITVTGPLNSGGKVELTNNWTLHLNRGLKYDEVAVFDTRPTKRTMTLNGSPINLLAPTGARLSQLSVNPGLNSVSLRGTSQSGTAAVTLQWRTTRKVI